MAKQLERELKSAHGMKWLAPARQVVGPGIQRGVGNLSLATSAAAMAVKTRLASVTKTSQFL
jgi:hypothetical protein